MSQNLPFEIFLALRYLRPKRTFVSVITLISVIGVTLGVGVLIIVISVMSGFDRQLREKILGFNSHLRVEMDQLMPDYSIPLGVIRSNLNVKGVAPYVLGPVLVETQGTEKDRRFGVPWVRGVEPNYETNVSVLPDSIRWGEFNLEGRSLLVGIDFAASLGLRLGDHVAVWSPRNLKRMRDAQGTKNEEAVLPDDYVIRGIFDVGYYEYNASVIATSLENAQSLYGLDESVHGLLVMLQDPMKAETVREELEAALGANYRIRTWMELNSAILSALMVEKNVMFYVLFFIMIVAAFGITGTLIAFVIQKTREIGILKALGAANAQIACLFLSQSILVGVLGVALGFGFGMLALSYRNAFLRLMNRLTGFELFPAEIYNFTELPAIIVPQDIAIIGGGALIMCMLAGVVPAIYAARLKPVEALRHE